MKRALAVGLLMVGISLTGCSPARSFCDTARDVPKSECVALSDFFQTTGGPNWKDRRGWLETPEVCAWFGITCSGGHVTGISMNYINITGQLPKSLAELDHLEVISMYYNEISGSIPAELGNLARLQMLILHHNHLDGNLPPELGRLSNLRSLDLDGNSLEGPLPPEFGNLRNLESLKLRDNRLSGELPAELGRLDRLRGLWISTNDFSGDVPKEWVGMASLTMFAAYGNERLGPLPAFLANLPPDGYPSWANPAVP